MDEPLSLEDARQLRRENDHLKTRVDQLQGEVWDLSSRLARSMQALERARVPAAAATPKDR